MAREYAKTNVTIWQDADWRNTPAPAQHLYLLMWTHPALDYCGVLDWRPGRLAQFAAGLTAETVTAAGACLQARQLIVVDDETEEALLRSWIRFDGLVGHDKLSVSMAKAFAGVASNKLRGVIVDELHKLHEREPGLCGWGKTQVQDLLAQPRIAARSLPVPADPLSSHASNASSDGASTPPRNPASSPLSLSGSSGSSTPLHQHLHQHPEHQLPEQPSAKPAGAEAAKGSRVPEPFTVTAAMSEWAQTNAPNVDISRETENFVDYWRAKTGRDATKLDWPATWRKWMRTASDRGPARRPTSTQNDNWMNP